SCLVACSRCTPERLVRKRLSEAIDDDRWFRRCHDLLPKFRRHAGCMPFEVPAKMLSGMAQALPLTVKHQHVGVMIGNIIKKLTRRAGYGEVLLVIRCRGNLACEPWPAVMLSADHHRVGAG